MCERKGYVKKDKTKAVTPKPPIPNDLLNEAQKKKHKIRGQGK